VPIIIISSQDSKDDKMKGFVAGANLFLAKPSDASKIVVSIKMLLGELTTRPPPPQLEC
jgi:two-component system chemotaxis response regulator CheY